MDELEQHHIRYKELHGEDEIIMLSHAEHRKVHREDKVNGFKPIPDWIVKAAYQRSLVGRNANSRYDRSKRGKERHTRHQQSESVKLATKIRCAAWRAEQKTVELE